MARNIFLASLIAAATATYADFSGPAPLAWRWSQATTVSPNGPIVAESGVVYAAVGGRVYAVDQESGNGKWRFPSGAPIESGNFKTGVLATSTMIVAAVDNKIVYGIDKETGAQKWQYISPEKVIGTPVSVGNFVALQLGDSSIMVLNAADGSAAWERPVKFLDGIVGQIAGFREMVIFGTQGDKIYAWDVVTKKQAWVQRLGRFNAEFKPVVYNDNIYCVNSDFLSVISGANGTRRWERNLRGTGKYFASVNQFGSAAVTGDGLVTVFDPSGREVFKKAVDLGSSSSAAPVLTSSVVAIPTANGAVNLLDSKTGAVKWDFVVRPLVATLPAGAEAGGSSGKGGGPGGFGSPGGGGGAQTTDEAPKYVTAAAAPVISGDALLLLARDGSMLSFDAVNGVDLTPPSVKMVFPNPGDAVNGQPPLQLFFKIADEASGLNTKTLKVTINGQEYESRLTNDGYVIVKFSGGKNQPLMDGRKEIKVSVSDWLGNAANQSFFLTIDNALSPIKLPGSDTNDPAQGGGKGGGKGKGGGFGGG